MLLPISINKILLEHSQGYIYMCVLSLAAFMLQWESWAISRDHMAHKVKNIY